MARIWSSGFEQTPPVTLNFKSKKAKENFLTMLIVLRDVEIQCDDHTPYFKVTSIDVVKFPGKGIKAIK